MKKLLILSVVILFSKNICFSQDIITLKNGNEITVYVNKVDIYTIEYKKAKDGPVYIIEKSDVFMIKYSNGSKDVFPDDKQNNLIKKENEKSEVEPYLQGQRDSYKYYQGKKCGAGGVILTTLIFSPILGLIPAISCSSTPPQVNNLNIPKSMLNNSEYIQGYQNEAHKIKKRIIWKTFGVSVGVNIILYSLLYTHK